MWEIKLVQHVPTINICSALHQDQKLSNYQVCTSLVIKQVWKCNPQHFLANPFLTNLLYFPPWIKLYNLQHPPRYNHRIISINVELSIDWLNTIYCIVYFFSEQGKFYIFSVLQEPQHWWQKYKVTCWFCFAFCDLI